MCNYQMFRDLSQTSQSLAEHISGFLLSVPATREQDRIARPPPHGDGLVGVRQIEPSGDVKNGRVICGATAHLICAH